METQLPQKYSFHLQPGYIYCSEKPITVHAVVGSCVTVCLWDRNRGNGAMNHYIYPATRSAAKATAQYGNVATLELVNMMLKSGSRPQDLVAHILGGASPENMAQSGPGESNVQVARQILKKKGILIASEDVGGCMGRKVVFDTGSGHVLVLKVHKLRETDWLSWTPS